MDYLKLYDLERYLFEAVNPAFKKDGKLTAFDFFSIVIWKANRAKSKVALKLLACDKEGRKDLDAIVGDLTCAIAEATTDKERMRILCEDWRFRLPMASAILTILYPEAFTVYDTRVCTQLGKHHGMQNRPQFDDLWTGYCAYVEDVMSSEPSALTLRDKDRILWARSFDTQLRDDITALFSKNREQ